MFKRLIIYIKQNKLEVGFLLTVVLISIYLRIYNLEKVLAFAYDQGRDALAVKDMLTNLKPVLIGPTTGVAGVFIGPLFYYLLAPFYPLTGWHPGWTAVCLAVLYSFSVVPLYFFVKQAFSRQSALICTVLFTCSFYAINFARWLSNPAPLIPISILMFMLVFVSVKYNWLLLWVGLLAGMSLQTELANGFFLSIALILFVIVNIKRYKPVALTVGFLGFAFTLLPQLIFNFRHSNILLNGLVNSFIGDQNKVSFQDVWLNRPQFILSWLLKSFGVYKFQFSWYTAVAILLFIFVFVLGWSLNVRRKNIQSGNALLLNLLWLFVPVISYLFYRGNYGMFFDYYLISLFIPILILISYLISTIAMKMHYKLLQYMAILLFVLPILKGSLVRADTFIDPASFGYSLERQQEAISWVFERMHESDQVWARPPNNLQHNYQYLLAWMGQLKLGRSVPVNVTRDADTIFVMFEPDIDIIDGKVVPRNLFLEWYESLTKERTMVDSAQFGIIYVQQWERY